MYPNLCHIMLIIQFIPWFKNIGTNYLNAHKDENNSNLCYIFTSPKIHSGSKMNYLKVFKDENNLNYVTF